MEKIELLKKIKTLLEEGLISENEFSILKSEILPSNEPAEELPKITSQEIHEKVEVNNPQKSNGTNQLNPESSVPSHKKNPGKKILISAIVLVGVSLIVLFSFGFFKGEVKSESAIELSENSDNDSSKTNTENKPDLSEVLNFVSNYYEDVNKNSFNAENYFSTQVDQYYSKKLITPQEINTIHRKNKDFIDGTSKVKNNEIQYVREKNQVNFYTYWIDFDCYRKSKNKYQSCSVHVEIGIDANNKIKSIREIEVKDLKFSNLPVMIDEDLLVFEDFIREFEKAIESHNMKRVLQLSNIEGFSTHDATYGPKELIEGEGWDPIQEAISSGFEEDYYTITTKNDYPSLIFCREENQNWQWCGIMLD